MKWRHDGDDLIFTFRLGWLVISGGVGGGCGTKADTGAGSVDRGGGLIPSIFSSLMASECLRCGRLFCNFLHTQKFPQFSPSKCLLVFHPFKLLHPTFRNPTRHGWGCELTSFCNRSAKFSSFTLPSMRPWIRFLTFLATVWFCFADNSSKKERKFLHLVFAVSFDICAATAFSPISKPR